MAKRVSAAEYIERISSRPNCNFLDWDGGFIGSSSRARCKCDYGHEWSSLIGNVLKYGCPECGIARRGVASRARESEQLAKVPGLQSGAFTASRIGEYVGTKTRYQCACSIDGHEWEAVLNNLIGGKGCPCCAGQTKTEADYLDQVSDLFGGSISLTRIGDYCGHKSRYSCLCSIDGHKWEVRLNSLLANHGCRKCATLRASEDLRADPDDIINKINSRSNRSFVRWVDGFINYRSEVVCCCDHGHEWTASVQSLVNSNTGCPECAEKRAARELRSVEGIASAAEGRHKFIRWSAPFEGSRSPAVCLCFTCGKEWETQARYLIGGATCPTCCDFGFQKDKPGALYALHSACGQWVKVGITNNPASRFKQLYRATPFKFKAVMVVEHEDGARIAKLEKDLHARMTRVDFGGEKFDGYTEWMEWDPALLGWLREFEQSAA